MDRGPVDGAALHLIAAAYAPMIPTMAAKLPTLSFELDKHTVLGKVAPSDAEELFDLVDSSRMYLREWLPWVDANVSPEHTRAFIARARAQDERGDGFQCVIRHRGKLVGVIGFHHVDWHHRRVEIGYWLAEEYQGRGIVTGASRALVGFAFNEWELHRVAIHVAVDNIKSRAVPERLGFVQEGTLRESERVGDRFLDTVVYAMLRSEWDG